jgi:hypothetical protein
VPLEAATVNLLRPIAGDGRVIQLARSLFQSLRRELCKEMRVRWPENCLRNSYATYAQTFRSSGDVARAMGDAEGTVKRYYVQTLEPGVGKKWFNLAADVAIASPNELTTFQRRMFRREGLIQIRQRSN